MNRMFKIILIGIGILISNLISAQEKQNIKVLFVLTSHDQLGNTGEKTGLWIEEFATPYYELIDQGVQITIASPKGGQPPIDPKSMLLDYQTQSTKRYFTDMNTQDIFSKTIKLSKINAKDYDAVFYPGGHGPLWDLSTDKESIKLIEDFYNSNKPIAFVCHAPAALKNVKNSDGEFLVKGKKVTGFSNTEEKVVELTEVVPFLVEDMLKENGGIYKCGKAWSSFAIRDGLLITGQNPQSSKLVTEYLMQAILEK